MLSNIMTPTSLMSIHLLQIKYSQRQLIQLISLSRTHKRPENLFEIMRVRDRERKIG